MPSLSRRASALLAVVSCAMAACGRPPAPAEPVAAFVGRSTQALSGGVMRLETTGVPETALDANIAVLAALGERAVFVATSSPSGSEMWATDGTRAGTFELSDVVDGTYSARPSVRCVGDGAALFYPGDDRLQNQVWVTDGTVAGTHNLPGISYISSCAKARGGLLLTQNVQSLQFYDAATGALRTIGTPLPGIAFGVGSDSVDLGGLTVMVAGDERDGAEPWVTDGTLAGTKLLADIWPGASSSSPRRFVVSGGKVWFIASEPAGRAPWVTDGTPVGTRRVAEPVPLGSADDALVAFRGGIAYANDRGLFVSDGTPAGTQRVGTVLPPGPSGREWLVSTGNLLAFVVGSTLYRSDGTTAGTTPVADLGGPVNLVSAGGRVFARVYGTPTPPHLWASDADVTAVTDLALPALSVVEASPGVAVVFTRSGVYKTDGTPAGTSILVQPNVRAGSAARPVTLRGNRALVLVDAPNATDQLWLTDGTQAGTTMEPTDGTLPVDFTKPLSVFPSAPYLYTSTAGALVATDGTAAGTQRIFDGVPTYGTAAVGHRYVFRDGPETSSGTLYLTDGTRNGTVPLGSARLIGRPLELGSRLFFDDRSVSTLNMRDVRTTDGTAAGTTILTSAPLAWLYGSFGGKVLYDSADGMAVTDETLVPRLLPQIGRIQPAGGGNNQYGLGIGNRFFYVRDMGSFRFELWVTDGTPAGTLRLVPLAGVVPDWYAEVDGRFMMFAAAPGKGYGLWVSDGTPAGTRFVEGVPGMAALHTTRFLATVGAGVLFTAWTPAEGTELWHGGRVAGSTYRIADLAPGVASSDPRNAVRLPDSVVFSADDGRGLQLFSIPTAQIDLPPTVTCPATYELEATVPAGTPLALVLPWKDTESEPVLATTPPLGTILALGSTTHVTATLTDAAGQTAGCGLDVHVRDTSPPTVTCPADLVVAATSAAGATVTYQPTAADNASVPTLDLVPPSGSALPMGATRVTATATDAGGRTASCSFTVTVRDLTPPDLTCPQDVTVEAAARAGTAVTWAGATATGVISSATVSYTPASGTVFPPGRTTVAVSATDEAGNAATCGFDVRVVDTTAPVLDCGAPVALEATSPQGAAARYTGLVAHDLFDVAWSYTPAEGTVLPLGTTAVTARATDTSGNASTCAFGISVVDRTPPAITCPPDLVVEASARHAADVTFAATATDAVSAPRLSYDPPPGRFGPSTVVTAAAADAAGNASTCRFTVRVVDTTRPRVTCPPTEFVEATDAQGALVTLPQPVGSDVGSDVTVATVPASGSRLPLGTTTVAATATDEAGLAATCSFDVVVRDTTPPALACPADVIAEEAGPGTTTVTPPAPTVSDAVGPIRLTRVPAGTAFPAGATPVDVTAFDGAENEAHCRYFVRVADTTPPRLACPPDVVLEQVSAAGASADYADAVASDAVSTPEVTYSVARQAPVPAGTTPVTVTARDAAGNVSACTFSVEVRDSVAPVLACPEAFRVEAAGADGVRVNFPDVVATDVTPVSVSYAPESGTLLLLGTTMVEASGRDRAGNAGRCTFDVTVSDTTAPKLVCPADLVLEATGAAGAAATFSPVEAVDRVSAVTVTSSVASGSTFPFGRTDVAFEARDAAGNRAACSFHVTVRDTTAPQVSCAAPLVLEATEARGARLAELLATASDDVSSAILATEPPVGALLPLGTTVVRAIAKDAAGNSATCTVPVTVVDRTAPEAVCPANVVVEATSPAGAEVTLPEAAASDLVGVRAIVSDPPSGTTFPLGTTHVLATATDAAGNAGTCSFDVVVRDTTAPEVACPDTVVAEASGPEGAVVELPAVFAQDVVGVSAVETTPPTGSTFALGTTPVRAVARDAAGNEASCAFDVQVRDTIAPVLTCPADPVVEATSAEGATVELPAIPADDAVGPTTVVVTPASGPFALGDTRVEATARDGAGHAAACAFTVHVRDTTPPDLSCPDEPVSPAQAAAVQGTDHVSAVTMLFDPPLANEFAPGRTPVTATARDEAGNERSCRFDVTVDAPPPPPSPEAPHGGCGGCANAGAPWAAFGLLFLLRMRRRRV